MQELKGRWAVVTGASSGIGEALARALARRGMHLLVTARRADRLERLAAELTAAHGVQVEPLPLDLSEGSAATVVTERAFSEARDVAVLVNNAGFADYQAFLHTPWERHKGMLELNVRALTELTYRFLERRIAAAHASYVLNVASIGAFMPVPYFANYAAGKAYVLSFSEALAAELVGSNVHVTCLCPGGTATEFSDVAQQRLSPTVRRTLMSSARVAEVGLRGLFRGRRVVIPGWTNRVICFLTRLVPRRLIGFFSVRTIGRPEPPASLPRDGA